MMRHRERWRGEGETNLTRIDVDNKRRPPLARAHGIIRQDLAQCCLPCVFGPQDEHARGVGRRWGFALARGWRWRWRWRRRRDGVFAREGEGPDAQLLEGEVQVSVDAHGRLGGDVFGGGLACDVETII